jgi:hypothetical protein
VNFPKLFQINGLQGLLPYFKFNPYAEWNDTVSADTEWVAEDYYLPRTAQLEFLSKLGLGSKTSYDGSTGYWELYVSKSFYPDSGYHVEYFESNDTGFIEISIANMVPDAGEPCLFLFDKSYDHGGELPGGEGIRWNANPTTGSFRLSACRDAGDGTAEFADVSARIKGPFYFTDAQGNKTYGPEDPEIDSLEQLKGKVVFRDPTFGGVFPGLTNDNIWSTIESLDQVESRTQRVCPDYPDMGPCILVLPSNPSDLDYFEYNLYWLDDVL